MRKKPFGQTQIYSVYFVTEITWTKLTDHITEKEQWEKKKKKKQIKSIVPERTVE